jgi:protein SCO1
VLGARTIRQRLLVAAVFVGVGCAITAATWAAFRHGVESPERLPVLGTVPEFALIGSNGQPLSRADLAGKVWVADFIFTHCPSLCPALSGQMGRVQKALDGDARDVRLVSFSVDPSNDTPEALRAYADRFHADSSRWLFVTGDRDVLHNLIGAGFHLAIAERAADANTDGEGLITHSDRFVLVDTDLQIRGYYHGTDNDSITQLLSDLQALGGNS